MPHSPHFAYGPCAMVLGSIIFAIALTDHFVHVLVSGDHRIKTDVLEQSHGE